jgi:hypothetical protein
MYLLFSSLVSYTRILLRLAERLFTWHGCFVTCLTSFCQPNRLYGTKCKDNWELWIQKDRRQVVIVVFMYYSGSCLEKLLTTTLWISAYTFLYISISPFQENYFIHENKLLAFLPLLCLSSLLWKLTVQKKHLVLTFAEVNNPLTTTHHLLRGPWPAGSDWFSSIVGPGSSPRTSCKPLQPLGRTKYWARRTLNGAYTLCT